MAGLLRFSTAIDAVNRAIGKAVAWLALVMVLVGAYNALARSAGDQFKVRLTTNSLVEAQWYLFSLLFLLGAPWALRVGAHVRVDVIYGRLGARKRWWLDLAAMLLFVVPFSLWAAWLTLEFAETSFALREGSNDPGGLRRWPLKAVMPAAFLLLALQGLSEAIKRWALLRGHSPEEVGLVERESDPAPGGAA